MKQRLHVSPGLFPSKRKNEDSRPAVRREFSLEITASTMGFYGNIVSKVQKMQF